MNEHGARDSDPPVQAGAGFEAFGYEGAIGKTTLDRVHVTIPDGSIESIQVYTRVNVGSHPHLAEAAQQGRLHRFDTGEFLAIPWVVALQEPMNQVRLSNSQALLCITDIPPAGIFMVLNSTPAS